MPTGSDASSQNKLAEAHREFVAGLVATLEKYPEVEHDLYHLLTDHTHGPADALTLLAITANRISLCHDLDPALFTHMFETLRGAAERAHSKMIWIGSGEMPKA